MQNIEKNYGKKHFPKKTILDNKINLNEIADKYELSGGAILNIVHYCSLMAMSRENNIILYDDLIHGIKKEFNKEGKTI